MHPMGRRRTKDHDLPPHMARKGKAYYYVTTTQPRKWIPLGSDLARAREQWAALENGISDSALLCNLLDDWLKSQAFDALADSSKKGYLSISRQIKEFFTGARAQDIRPHHIATWMDEHPSRSQANLGRAVLSNVMALAVRRGHIDRNPVAEISRHNIKGRERYLTDAEYLAIRAAAHPVLRAAMDISYITAGRIGDILAIKLADIDETGLRIKQQKTGKLQLFRTTPALQDAIAQARAIPRPVRGLHLLCTQRGKAYSYATIQTWWNAARDKAGLSDAHFHDIRAKSATDAKRDGQDYQALLGHSTQAMSNRYIKIEEPQEVEPRARSVKE